MNSGRVGFFFFFPPQEGKEMWMINTLKIHHVGLESKASGQLQNCPFDFKSTYQQR